MRKLQQIKAELIFYKRLATDPRTPKLAKVLFLAALGYLALPFDLLPDFIPVIGQLDDLLIVSFLLWLALKITPDTLKRIVRYELKN